MIRWVFFDVGNVLFIDEPLTAMQWEELDKAIHASGHQISFEALMERRETLVHRNQDAKPFITLGHEFLGEEGWAEVHDRIHQKIRQDYFAYNFLIDGTGDVLENLSASYKLGVAANQPKFCRQALETAGLLGYFSVVGISADLNLSKPDPRFFEGLLAEADCPPSEAIMIGDRIDNDIAPAKQLGMRAIWFNLHPEAHGYVGKSDLERLYIESLRRAPSRGTGHPGDHIEPDITITSLAQVVEAVAKIANDRD